MKKKMALALILVLVVSNSMVAFGATSTKERTAKYEGSTWNYYKGGSIDNAEDKNSQDVTASYSFNEDVVYNVDIVWGNMQYTYSTTSGTGAGWNPSNHTYKDGTETWKVSSSGTDDAVTVKNHSNARVYPEFECEFVNTYSNLKGRFTKITNDSSSDSTFDNGIGNLDRNPYAMFELNSAVNRGTSFTGIDSTGLPQGKVKFEIDGDPGSILTNEPIGKIKVTIATRDPIHS